MNKEILSNTQNGKFVEVKNYLKSKKPLKLVKKVLSNLLRVILLLGCLYFFIIALDLMSSGFRLIAGKSASKFLSNNVILKNPIAGLVIGIVVTVLVQSSSTSSSIIVSMVGAGVLSVKQSIPIIMGANVGTSITSTIVSLAQVSDKKNFCRAFAAATVHDCFNLLSVAVLLPLELVSGYLLWITGLLVNLILKNKEKSDFQEPQLFNAITKPLTNLIIQLDSKVLNEIALEKPNNDTLIKHICSKSKVFNDSSLLNASMLLSENEKCKFLFEGLKWPEWSIGLLILAISLALLCSCLIGMVKVLSAIFKGSVSKIIQKVINSDPPGVFRFLTGFIAMTIGCIFTIIVQSSSVFTSTLVPLVGMGLITIERVFPLTLGSNIGTTITGILAALGSSSLRNSLQIALCHTLFNISGIIIWYPLPFLRAVPIKLAKFLGQTVSEYRWFAIVYMILVFIVIPLIIFSLSLAGLIAFLCVFVPIVFLIICILIFKFLQKKIPNKLPQVLRNWNFLPLPLRSLKPYDDLLNKCCCKCCNKLSSKNEAPYSDINENSTRF